MSDQGGLYQCILIVIFNISQPIAKFSFLLKAIKRLYLAKTKDDDFFNKIRTKKSSSLFYLPESYIPKKLSP